jgi:hypothetical protein
MCSADRRATRPSTFLRDVRPPGINDLASLGTTAGIITHGRHALHGSDEALVQENA